ncbi:flavodoxin domain-containing protein [Marinococcus halophilus]|uniref:flavodoxin domain-containing protein n=2 Tax=Marinococcus halophilus TaxID=1371 RepID=UPI0011BD75C6|nr:flavodoxin domain-containing protein [Marinococcus halophilus]
MYYLVLTPRGGGLHYEVEDNYAEMGEIQLKGLQVALFGSCDFMYPKYGRALDLIEGRFQKHGAQIVAAPLKVEIDPREEEARAARKLVDALLQKKKVKTSAIP